MSIIVKPIGFYGRTTLLLFCIIIAMTITACAFFDPGAVSEQNNPAIKVEPMAGVSEQGVNEVQQAADVTMQFFAQNMGMHLENPVTIVLLQDRKAYLAEVQTRFKVSEIEAERATKGTDALAGQNLIVVNVSGMPTVRQKTFLIAHELTHQYQHQIAGDRQTAVMWMLEGMADAVGAQVVNKQGYFTITQYKANWQSGLMAANTPTLTELRDRNGWSAALSQYGSTITYKTAALAVLRLTDRFGQQKVIDYFSNLGSGEDPENSFQKAFGIPMAEFIIEFERSLHNAA